MVKVGIIGAGFMGKMHSQVYKVLPDAELIAISDINKENAKEILPEGKIYTDYKELLKDKEIDIVDICLPTFMHKDAVIDSARAGKNILCEKPISLSIKDADEMIRETKKANVKFMVAQCIRFWPEYIFLKEITEEKKFGKILHASFRRLSPLPTWSWNKWLLSPERSGSVLFDLHIHDVDYLLYLLGKPQEIFSQGVKEEFGWSHIFSIFIYRDGRRIFLEGGWGYDSSFPFHHTYLVKMEKATIEMNPRYKEPIVIYQGEKKEIPEIKKAESKVDTGGNIEDLGGYYNEIEYFVKCVKENHFPEVVTPESARESLYLVTKEKESIEKGRVVKV